MSTPPINEHARELLSAWARHGAPSAAVKERTWGAVQARAQAGELGPELGPEVTTTAARVVGLRLILGGLALTAVVVGVGWGLLGGDRSERASMTKAMVVETEPALLDPLRPWTSPWSRTRALPR